VNLTDAQREAIAVPAAVFQTVACAGSGKTEVLARRVVSRLLQGVPPDGIAAFTFTEKAAAELKSRIEQRAAEADERFAALPPSAAGLFVGTIHSYCLRCLQQCGGVYELFDPLPEEREWALLHRFGRRLGLVDLMTQTWPGRPVSVRRAVEVFVRSLAVVHNERVSRRVLQDRVPAFAAAVERYEDLLTGMQLLSFDQMVELACRELAPDGRLRAMLQGRVREVFVDEYQDLNRAQEELLRHLVDMGAHLTVVGDDDQAIYQWRGGDVSIFIHFAERFADSEQRTLGENHRSVEPIVFVTSRFVHTVGHRVEKDIRAARQDAAPAIELLAGGTPQAEARLITERIQMLLEAGHRPADIAVLYRSVRSSAKPLIDALRKEAIPAAAVGKLSLLDRPEMALVARVFVLWAGGSWMPDEEPEVVTAERLAADLSELTSVDQVEAARVIAELEHMGKGLSSEGVPDLIGLYMDVLKRLGLPVEGPGRSRQERGLGQLSDLLADFEHAQRRAAPAKWYSQAAPTAAEEVAEDSALLQAATAAPQETLRLGRSLGEIYLARLRVFLEEFASAAVEEAPERPTLEQDAVNIMTIHQSKGLEFSVVFVPSLVERRFPSSRMGREVPWYLPDDLFEKVRYQGREDDERRLFYVAMTRARELLVLSWFNQYPSETTASCSRFVEDLARITPKQYLKRLGECRPAARPRPAVAQPVLETNFSELYAFSECPRQYYFRCVCNFQPPLAPELGFGKLLHHGVAELARRAMAGRRVGAADVDEIVAGASYLPFAGPIARERLYKAARRRLANYVRRHGLELERTLAPERQFEVPLEAARIMGRIDLMLWAEGGGEKDVELLDFKTAANRPPSDHHKNQLRLYGQAARVLGLNPVRLAIHDLDADNGGRVLVEDDLAAADRFRSQLHTWVQRIAVGEFEPPRRCDKCASCDFAQLCGRRWPLK
jgi:DNA helicase-2/ATP-dependent DNA helicase PcrA